MKAQVLFGINDLRFERAWKEPDLHSGEVLVQAKACGICGSDVGRVLKTGTYHFPTIIGHEFSGEVVQVFDEENRMWLHKRVSVFPLIPCKKCAQCLRGNFQLCERYDYLGSRRDGGFSEYVAVPTWNLLEIPEGVSYEEAAMLEPAAVAVHALKYTDLLLGSSLLITGTGTIASILARLSVFSGAASVTVAGRNERKLSYIQEHAPAVQTLRYADLCEDCFDVVVESTGATKVLSSVIGKLRRQGKMVLLGNPSSDCEIPKSVFWQILRKELTVKGSWNSSYGLDGKNDWNTVFALLSDGRLRLADLITHRLSLENLYDGIRLMYEKKELSNKVVVLYE